MKVFMVRKCQKQVRKLRMKTRRNQMEINTK